MELDLIGGGGGASSYELGRIAGLREAASMILAQGRDLVNKREMSNVLNRLADKLETGEAK